MRKKIFLTFSVSLLLLFVALPVSAHEVHTYKIGNKTYEIVVGSLNEPITVDDKTGVDFQVHEITNAMTEEHDEMAMDHSSTPGAVAGLDQTVKVEVSAGGKKRVFDLSPTFGTPGAYKAVFYPTVQTTLTYRFFGTINSTEVDLSFSCNPAGHPQADEDKSQVAVSEGVTRLSKRGAFSCPVAKADLGFPEPSVSNYDLNSKVDALGDSSAPASKSLTTTALTLAGLSLIVSALSFFGRSRRP